MPNQLNKSNPNRLEKITGIILHCLAFANLFLLVFARQADAVLPNRWGIKYNSIVFLILSIHIVLTLYRNKFHFQTFRSLIFDIVFILLYPVLYPYYSIYFFYLIVRQVVVSLIFLSVPIQNRYSLFRSIIENPAMLVLLSFAIMIVIGTFLLMLPSATNTFDSNGSYVGSTSFIDALFTATSATCVTGLIVHDTGSHFTFFGQFVILILIQIGGLGIMTISTALAIIIGQRITLRTESIMQDVTGESSRIRMVSLIKNILVLTLIVEFLGMIPLYYIFDKDIFSAIFHSISAFCNAGFSTYSDSFMKYYNHWGLNITIMGLIILGGIGFSVLTDVKRTISSRYGWNRLTLHSKIVIVSTFVLILIGFLVYFIFEFNKTMHDYPFHERILASLFQSVTTRTAGFNTIDNARLSFSSIFVTLFLMFIGASPGSTGGGVKTTTISVIFLAVLSILRGKEDVSAFRRKIPDETIRRVLALMAISITLLFIMIPLLLMTGIEKTSELNNSNQAFPKIIFEAFSAFGTVGLSMGATSHLSNIGKILIIILMYFGRVGPLTLIYINSAKIRNKLYTYPEEKLGIG
ncbi:MAG: TrkH family potassium uptake protein [Candidatus Cloacimonetes bacterium]|nr:TrkH family potassium uptake protein [Candidatus Cloacimonadota bacterium]